MVSVVSVWVSVVVVVVVVMLVFWPFYQGDRINHCIYYSTRQLLLTVNVSITANKLHIPIVVPIMLQCLLLVASMTNRHI